MREIKRRPALAIATRNKLASQKASLLQSADPASICEQRFNGARARQWFNPVRDALKDMSGTSQTCMFCDHNEPTDVEHFRPKVPFPRRTFSWGNMLWVCTTCNRKKNVSFPPHNRPGAPLVDPTLEYVWDYFFLDQFGNLVKKWDVVAGSFHARAQSTCDYIFVDRDEIQTRRRKRLKSLQQAVTHSLADHHAGNLTIPQLSQQISDWLAEPYQADVADFFLRGPGRVEQPFAQLFALGAVAPPL